MSITLLQLRTQARQRADMERSRFVSDSELTDYINASIAELHDILIQSYGTDYFVVPYTFNTVSGTSDYALPAAFYKLHGVDAKVGTGDYISIQRFNFNERNRFDIPVVWNMSGIPLARYRLVGNNVSFSPTPDQDVEVRLWYSPVATKLVADSDTLTDLNQYAEYVIVDAAIKMLQKEESDVTVLMAQKQLLTQRITVASQNRDVGQPESISDIYAEGDWYYGGE